MQGASAGLSRIRPRAFPQSSSSSQGMSTSVMNATMASGRPSWRPILPSARCHSHRNTVAGVSAIKVTVRNSSGSASSTGPSGTDPHPPALTEGHRVVEPRLC